ncbi:MAG: sugar transferase [Deltaproteobacteria bacterium]|nr:sugar transferase [Deltaproteobacteria bacterium]
MPDPLLGLEPYLGVAIPGWKRAFDMICSSTGLIVLSPLLMLVAIMIKIVSPGPVFFVQERVGYLGKHFGLLKFRTMKANTDTSVHEDYIRELMKTGESMKKLEHDPRIIPCGNLLRKTGLDELPQLINVVRGQMSLVGPRPCLPVEFEGYLQWHKRRFYTAPGITGLWQVSGKNRLTFKEMIRRDITYEQKRSLGLDLKILFKTFPAVANIMKE